MPVAGNADHYARIVKANAMLRRLLEASHKHPEARCTTASGEPRDLVEQAERMMFEVAHDTASQDFASIADILERETTRLEELSEGKRDLTGTPSGFCRPRRGSRAAFSPATSIIFAARPAMGKSAVVANIADFVAVEKKQPVAFFSLEMSETELAHRFLACQGRHPRRQAPQGAGEERLGRRSSRPRTSSENAPIWIDTSVGPLDPRLRAKARRLYSKAGGLGLSSSTTCSSCARTIRG